MQTKPLNPTEGISKRFDELKNCEGLFDKLRDPLQSFFSAIKLAKEDEALKIAHYLMGKIPFQDLDEVTQNRFILPQDDLCVACMGEPSFFKKNYINPEISAIFAPHLRSDRYGLSTENASKTLRKLEFLGQKFAPTPITPSLMTTPGPEVSSTSPSFLPQSPTFSSNSEETNPSIYFSASECPNQSWMKEPSDELFEKFKVVIKDDVSNQLSAGEHMLQIYFEKSLLFGQMLFDDRSNQNFATNIETQFSFDFTEIMQKMILIVKNLNSISAPLSFSGFISGLSTVKKFKAESDKILDDIQKKLLDILKYDDALTFRNISLCRIALLCLKKSLKYAKNKMDDIPNIISKNINLSKYEEFIQNASKQVDFLEDKFNETNSSE